MSGADIGSAQMADQVLEQQKIFLECAKFQGDSSKHPKHKLVLSMSRTFGPKSAFNQLKLVWRTVEREDELSLGLVG